MDCGGEAGTFNGWLDRYLAMNDKNDYVDTVKCAAKCREKNKNGCCTLNRYGCQWYEGKVSVPKSSWMDKSAVLCEVTGRFMKFVKIFSMSCRLLELIFIDFFVFNALK